jgi:hypothetical protein
MAKLRASNRPRATASLNSKLERNLIAYVTAAGTAGLALSALTPFAEAKIVYTATNTTVTDGTTIDLNGDGVPDFSFGFEGGVHSIAMAVHGLTLGDAILCVPGTTGCLEAAAGIYGRAVGPAKQFLSHSNTAAFSGSGVIMAIAAQYGASTAFFGPWAGAKNRYLGFRFVFGSTWHYGWARLSVGNYLLGGKVVLTGYAYESKANTKILEGHETGPDRATLADSLVPFKAPAGLGLLARGHDALAIWRREDEPVA